METISIEQQASHFINVFGEHSLKVVELTRKSKGLYHPSQEDLFKMVELIFKAKRK